MIFSIFVQCEILFKFQARKYDAGHINIHLWTNILKKVFTVAVLCKKDGAEFDHDALTSKNESENTNPLSMSREYNQIHLSLILYNL